MTGVALAWACALAVPALAAPASLAPRQAPAPGAVLGGGRLGPVYADPQPDLHLTSLVVSADGTSVTVRGDWAAVCGDLVRPVTATFAAEDVPIAEDGSFSASGPVATPGAEGTFALTGAFTSPTSAVGVGSVRFTLHGGSGDTSCRTPAVTWEVRADARLTGRPRPLARRSYFGTTAQGLPLVLRVSPNRYRLSQVALRWRASCNATAASLDGIALAPPTAASVKGTFTTRFSSVGEPAAGEVSVTASTLRGTFGTGTVGGVYQSTTRVWDVASGALLDICATGRVSWAARL